MQHTTRWLPVYALICALICALVCAAVAQTARAETPPRTDVWPPEDTNQYWEGTLPSGLLQGLSTDAVLPLLITLGGSPRPTLNADPLSFITVEVRPQSDPTAAPIPGELAHFHLLVLWRPLEPLDPLTTYDVTVTVDNTGLRDGGPLAWPDLRSDLQLTTAEGVLITERVDLPTPTVSYLPSTEWMSCPGGQAVCADGDPSSDGASGCAFSVPFTWSQPELLITWRDGDPTDGDLFFLYSLMSAHSGDITGDVTAHVFESAHSVSHPISFSEAGEPEVCVTLTAIDLRDLGVSDAPQPQTLIACASLADMPPIPSPDEVLADCAPIDPSAPDGEDADDVTRGDAASDADVGASNPQDEAGCGCTTTRAPQGQPPTGLLLGLAAAFGLAATLRRRRSSGGVRF